MVEPKVDLTGKEFGYLKVIEPATISPKGTVNWRCLCRRCQKETIIPGWRLTDKYNPKNDCGCSYAEKTADLTGRTIGAITVLKRVSGSRYLCRCEICGIEKEFPASTIRKGMKSCGCLKRTKEHMKKMSDIGVPIAIVNEVNINLVRRKEANQNSTTGVRGVYKTKKGTFCANVQVRKERHRKNFQDVEQAKEWRDAMQKELIEKYHVKL